MRFARAMGTIGQRSAELVTGTVSFRPNEYVLDLGGGPGQYQKSLCEKYENIKVTLFDLDETIKIARKDHKNHPAADRMYYISGDFFIDDFNGKYDTILVSNVVHIYGPEKIANLFSRCHNSLNQNGRILIKDFFLTRETEQLPFTHLFALHMLLSTETGRCYSYQEIKKLMLKSGFRMGNKHQLTATSLLIEGIKN
jgi:cyclopropane fatty-acyl-phospholipid synthase-like methyltransferase